MAGDLKGRFLLRDVYRKGWSGLASKGEAARAIEVLVDSDWLRKTPDGVYHVNLRLMDPAKKTATPWKSTDNTDNADRGAQSGTQIRTDKTDKTDKTDRRLGDELLSVLSVHSGGSPKLFGSVPNKGGREDSVVGPGMDVPPSDQESQKKNLGCPQESTDNTDTNGTNDDLLPEYSGSATGEAPYPNG